MSSPATPASAVPKPSADAAKGGRIPWMRLAYGAVALVLAAAAGYWFFALRFEQSTDDAYVGGNVTVMAPKVNGFVTDILVQDNQHVSANQVLIRLDARDYDAKLAQATAEVDSARAAVVELQAKQALQAAVINQHQAEVRASSAELTRSAQDQTRYRELVPGRRRKVTTREPGDLPSIVVTRGDAGRGVQALASPTCESRG